MENGQAKNLKIQVLRHCIKNSEKDFHKILLLSTSLLLHALMSCITAGYELFCKSILCGQLNERQKTLTKFSIYHVRACIYYNKLILTELPTNR